MSVGTASRANFLPIVHFGSFRFSAAVLVTFTTAAGTMNDRTEPSAPKAKTALAPASATYVVPLTTVLA